MTIKKTMSAFAAALLAATAFAQEEGETAEAAASATDEEVAVPKAAERQFTAKCWKLWQPTISASVSSPKVPKRQTLLSVWTISTATMLSVFSTKHSSANKKYSGHCKVPLAFLYGMCYATLMTENCHEYELAV